MEDRARPAVGQPTSPGRGPVRQLVGVQPPQGRHAECGGGVHACDEALALVQGRDAESGPLRVIPGRVDRDHNLERGAGGAQGAHALQEVGRRADHRGEKAAPGKDDRELVGHAGQLGRQLLDRGAYVHHVVELGAQRAARVLAQAGGVGVDADEQTVGCFAGADVGQPSVAATEVDRDPTPVSSQQLSESLIGAFETLAAYEIHGSRIAERPAAGPPDSK